MFYWHRRSTWEALRGTEHNGQDRDLTIPGSGTVGRQVQRQHCEEKKGKEEGAKEEGKHRCSYSLYINESEIHIFERGEGKWLQ